MKALSVTLRDWSCVLLFAVVACRGGHSPRNANGAEAAPTATPRPTTEAAATRAGLKTRNGTASATDAERLSLRWLEALRVGNIEQLRRLTVIPFELREPVEYPSCQAQDVRSAQELRDALACLLDDSVLREELGGELGGASASAIGAGEWPGWAKVLGDRQPRDASPVRAIVPGVGVNFEFLLFVNADGVRAVWKYAEYDPN